MISNEKFMEPLQNTISKLKLRASYGLVGNDNVGSERFYYLSEISMNSSAVGASFGSPAWFTSGARRWST